MVRPDLIERLRIGYAAYNRGEEVELFVAVTDDFEVRDRPELPDPQVHYGQEGARTALALVREEFDDYVVEPQDFVEVGDCVVVAARQRGRGRASGAVVEGDIFHVWKLRGEQVAGMRAFSTREDAVAAARSWST